MEERFERGVAERVEDVHPVKCSVEAPSVFRGEKSAIVFVQVSDQRIAEDSIKLVVYFEQQIINLRCCFPCILGREKLFKFVLNVHHLRSLPQLPIVHDERWLAIEP